MSLDAIGIVSEDLAKSLMFYRLLGLAFEKMGGGDHYETKTPSGVRLMLDSVAIARSLEPTFQKKQGNGISLCFKQPSAAEVDRLYAAITGAGFKGIKAPWDAVWGQRYACVADPDGQQVDLFAAL